MSVGTAREWLGNLNAAQREAAEHLHGPDPGAGWRRLGKDPVLTARIARLVIVAFVSSAACAIVIAWYLDLPGIVPFAFLGLVITFNNFLAAVVVGPILLALLYPRVKRWGLVWTDIMDKGDVAAGFVKGLGSILMVIGAIGGLVVGVLVAIGAAGQTAFGFTGASGQVAVWVAVLPFLVVLIAASFMLSGRWNSSKRNESSRSVSK